MVEFEELERILIIQPQTIYPSGPGRFDTMYIHGYCCNTDKEIGIEDIVSVQVNEKLEHVSDELIDRELESLGISDTPILPELYTLKSNGKDYLILFDSYNCERTNCPNYQGANTNHIILGVIGENAEKTRSMYKRLYDSSIKNWITYEEHFIPNFLSVTSLSFSVYFFLNNLPGAILMDDTPFSTN